MTDLLGEGMGKLSGGISKQKGRAAGPALESTDCLFLFSCHVPFENYSTGRSSGLGVIFGRNQHVKILVRCG